MHYVKTPTPTNERMDDTLTPLAMREKNGNARTIAFLPEILLQLSITPSSFRSLSFTQTTHIHTRPEKSRVKNG